MGIFYPKSVATARIVLHDYGTNIQQPKPFIFQPVSVNITKNSYNEADTFSMVARWEDMPLDARLIRSMLVSISIFDLKKLKAQSEFDLNQVLKSAAILGFVDTHSIALSGSGREVYLEGRDYTSLFLETKFDNANLDDGAGKRTRKISLARPLRAIIQDLKSNVPGADGIQIEDRTGGAVTNALVSTGGNFTLQSGVPSTNGMFEYVQNNETYWDVIQSLCEAVGVICYIELDKLVLTSPRILFHGQGFSSKQKVPFVYGHNLESLEFKKNLSRKKRFNILLRSWDIKAGTPVEVSIPRDARQSWATENNIQKAIQKVQELGANGEQVVKDAPSFTLNYRNKTRDQLILIGEKVFNEFVRQQVEGSFTTKEMAVSDSSGIEIDVTQLKTGAVLKLEIVQEDIEFIVRKDADGQPISDSKRLAYLIRRGYSVKTAQALIDAVSKSSGKIQPTFYLRGYSMSMDGSGFMLRVDFVNFIELGTKEAGKIYSG